MHDLTILVYIHSEVKMQKVWSTNYSIAYYYL